MDDERKNLFYLLGLGTQLGLMVALTLAGLLVAGVYLDRYLGTRPLFIILGVVLGFIGAGIEMKQVILPFLEKKLNNKDNNQKVKNNNKDQ